MSGSNVNLLDSYNGKGIAAKYAEYAEFAGNDVNGNNIAATYATKSELSTATAGCQEKLTPATVTAAASISVSNNTVSTIANDSLSAMTIDCTVTNGECANFACEISTEVACTLAVTINTMAAHPSVSGGTSMEAGKFYQLTCVGTCWTLAEFETQV